MKSALSSVVVTLSCIELHTKPAHVASSRTKDFHPVLTGDTVGGMGRCISSTCDPHKHGLGTFCSKSTMEAHAWEVLAHDHQHQSVPTLTTGEALAARRNTDPTQPRVLPVQPHPVQTSQTSQVARSASNNSHLRAAKQHRCT